MNDVAGFLANGGDPDAAEDAARRALKQQNAGRDEIIRLADVLSQHEKNGEALSRLEQAWVLSDSTDKRMETDERILAPPAAGRETRA